MAVLLSIAPILLILILMVGFRWGAAKAGAVGWIATMLIAVLDFGAGLDLLALAQSKALFLTLDVLLVIWGAFLLFRVAEEAGAIKTLGQALPQLVSDRGLQALLISWPFASFLQGVGGMGVPVAVTAPLMIGLGFTPLVAVIAPSLGHAWSVTFGSLAASFNALMATTNLPGGLLSAPAALLLGMTCLACGLMVAHAADGWGAVRRLAIPGIAMGTGMALTQYLLATNGMWNIGGFGAGMSGIALGFLSARWYHRNRPKEERSVIDVRTILLAFSAYFAVILATLLIEFATPLRNVLTQFEISVKFPETRTALGFVTPSEYGRKIMPFVHAGAVLTYASASAYLIYHRAGLYESCAFQHILRGTVKQVLPPSLGIAVMVSLAVVMSHVGMTDILAQGLAQGAGTLFPLTSPWIGALGAFMTGSNTNSNIVFASLQQRTAELLGYSVPLILGAQTAGGAIGSVMAPTKIIVGASTAGMAGKEGMVLRGLLVYIGVLIIGLSLAVFTLVRVWPK